MMHTCRNLSGENKVRTFLICQRTIYKIKESKPQGIFVSRVIEEKVDR
ncbi:hypothetical protein CASFOL_036502 [Castilleja foliolosa]|uniref:Uncharacterized protein n=1 Tax=Castilleja foliolosa TaxID=1961234 RepID=A0ABD3BVQ5_9LAMI